MYSYFSSFFFVYYEIYIRKYFWPWDWIYSLDSFFQGTATKIWPREYQSTNDLVKLHQAASLSRINDDENFIHHHTLSRATRLKLINRHSVGLEMDVMRQYLKHAAWQTLANASSNNTRPMVCHSTRADQWEDSTKPTKVSKAALVIGIIPSSQPRALNVNKHAPVMAQEWRKANHYVTLSTAESFSIGRLQAVSENCCQFLYSLICFHFCMQVSQIHISLACQYLFIIKIALQAARK